MMVLSVAQTEKADPAATTRRTTHVNREGVFISKPSKLGPLTQPELVDLLQSPALGLGNSAPDKQESGYTDSSIKQKNSRRGEHGDERKKGQGHDQIGRASCRERVESRSGAVTVKQ